MRAFLRRIEAGRRRALVALPPLAGLVLTSGASARSTLAYAEHHPAIFASDTVPGVPADQTLRWPSAVMRRDTMYIAANMFPTKDVSLRARPLVLLRAPGTPIPLPDGEFLFAYPKLVASHAGDLHLFWGEYDQIPTRPMWSGWITRVWHARWARGRWSKPDEVIHAPVILWSEHDRQIVVDGNDRISLVIPAAMNGGTPTLVYVRGVAAEWSTHAFEQFANYASIAVTGPHSLMAAFVGPNAAVQRDHGSVFMTRSVDDGSHWTTPVVVSSVPGQTAFAPQLFDAGQALGLAWYTGVNATREKRLIVTAGAFDGSGWTTAFEEPLPTTATGFRIGGMKCGDVVALVETFEGQRPNVRKVTWRRGAPAIATALAPELESASSAAIGVADRSLWAVFNSKSANATTVRPAVAPLAQCMKER